MDVYYDDDNDDDDDDDNDDNNKLRGQNEGLFNNVRDGNRY